jgi:hypothetical protein
MVYTMAFSWIFYCNTIFPDPTPVRRQSLEYMYEETRIKSSSFYNHTVNRMQRIATRGNELSSHQLVRRSLPHTASEEFLWACHVCLSIWFTSIGEVRFWTRMGSSNSHCLNQLLHKNGTSDHFKAKLYKVIVGMRSRMWGHFSERMAPEAVHLYNISKMI